MELVYLWVEDYKNIKRQGFNFSPRFECSYDEKSKELTIDKKEHIENLFGENINVTAIVGENGAGKSTIQKLIFLLIFLKKYETTNFDNPLDNPIIEILNDKKLKDKNIFLIIHTEDGYRKISLLSIFDKYKEKSCFQRYCDSTKPCLISKYKDLENINFFSMHFHYMIDTWYDDVCDSWTNSIYHRVDGYDTPLLQEPYKGHENGNNYIDISNMEYLNNSRIFSFYGELQENKQIASFFNPNKIWRMIDTNKIINKFEKFNGFSIEKDAVKVYEEFINKKSEEKDLISLNKLYLAIKILEAKKDIFRNENIIQETRDKLISITNEDDIKFFISNFLTESILAKEGLPETNKIESCIAFDEKFKEDLPKLSKYENAIVLDPSNVADDKYIEISEVFELFEQLVPWIYVEFYEDDKSFSSLSSGEKMFLNFSLNIMYQIENIEKQEDTYNTINLFLDEVEFGLHPDWQKRFVKEVLFLLKNTKYLVNIIYATHSPFILSDIPKENVIFLKDGKQIDVDIETFGANIHTLLSHGFFMDGGLMGEFAKDKINKAIEYLNKKKLTEKEIDYCENIISIIGEPIIKRQLQKMLDSKRLSKIDEIDKLSSEIEFMKHRIDILRKNQ